MILEDVLETSFGAIFSQDAWYAVNDGAVKSHEMVMLNVLHRLQFHHKRAVEIYWNVDFLYGARVALVGSNWNEYLLIGHELFREARLELIKS